MQKVKPEEKYKQTEIILKDEKMDPIIRKLIALSFKRGYCKSNVAKAVIAMWDELYEAPKEVFSPTEEEKDLWRKASKFVEMYSDLLIDVHDKDYSVVKYHNEVKGDEKREKNLLREIEVFLCAAFCTFCREDTIKKPYVEKYTDLIEKDTVYYVSEVAKYVYTMISSELRYDMDNQYRPERAGTKDGLVYLYSVKAKDEFCEQYKYWHTKFSDATMVAIWFITTYID